MGWALAVVHPCSWRSNSSDRSRYDWRRNKGGSLYWGASFYDFLCPRFV